jgi:hypothetical protein
MGVGSYALAVFADALGARLADFLDFAGLLVRARFFMARNLH